MTGIRILLAAVLCASTALCFEPPPDGAMMDVPHNEIMVLTPFDGDVVDHDPLAVQVATGYGVLTFLTITLNGRVALDVGNIDVGDNELWYGDKARIRRASN